jgi:hypothetical protein
MEVTLCGRSAQGLIGQVSAWRDRSRFGESSQGVLQWSRELNEKDTRYTHAKSVAEQMTITANGSGKTQRATNAATVSLFVAATSKASHIVDKFQIQR